jgi:hypothetical protein
MIMPSARPSSASHCLSMPSTIVWRSAGGEDPLDDRQALRIARRRPG